MNEKDKARQTWRVGYERAWIDAHREQARRTFVGPRQPPQPQGHPWWYGPNVNGAYLNGTFGT